MKMSIPSGCNYGYRDQMIWLKETSWMIEVTTITVCNFKNIKGLIHLLIDKNINYW